MQLGTCVVVVMAVVVVMMLMAVVVMVMIVVVMVAEMIVVAAAMVVAMNTDQAGIWEQSRAEICIPTPFFPKTHLSTRTLCAKHQAAHSSN